jgi:hypothetical protein
MKPSARKDDTNIYPNSTGHGPTYRRGKNAGKGLLSEVAGLSAIRAGCLLPRYRGESTGNEPAYDTLLETGAQDAGWSHKP